ncbi:hypothetical protein [Rhizobium laguerreae]|uniref:hypothetical protein n=1 Tax=Rhizobium laguerreae TaxID=1076926 RepID=UPI001C90B6F2|nr:hypothetical protein [Rhizobium laguerreae]MBY3369035.1 hypothetical protein [Rhizobium laguerreae]
MGSNIYDLFEEVLLLEDLHDCSEDADEARVRTLGAMLYDELNAAHSLRPFMVETWREGQQTVKEALGVREIVEAATKRFSAFCAYADGFSLDDDFHMALSHLHDLYNAVIRISEDNLRVADGRGRRRDPYYGDDFIGPTAYIAF